MAIIDCVYRVLNIKDSKRDLMFYKKSGIKIGENVDIINSNLDVRFYSLIEIGNNVTITNSTILAHDASTKKFIGYTKCAGVSIGDNVFIGYGSIVLPGTHIGDNVIIGAGSVVRGNIPDNSVAVGNPATVICSTDEYIKRNVDSLNDNIYDINKPEDISRMSSGMKKGFVL